VAEPEPNPENEPTIVERWLEDQRQWQRTMLSYLDAMTKNDDFLVHLGNAMRGSLLAGKPYPSTPPAAAETVDQAAPDDRLDKVLFALHRLEGQLADVQMTLDEIRDGRPRSAAAPAPAARKRPRARVKKAAVKTPAARASKARTPSKARKRKGHA
jgi:hypothetical protein